jgi:hypothetical protein
MTTLNTAPFRDAYNALNKAKFPLSHDNRIAYVALATMLEVCVNYKMGISQIQKTLDEKTNEYKSELENLVSGFERLVK